MFIQHPSLGLWFSNALNSPTEASGTAQMLKVKPMLECLLNQGDEKSNSEVSHRFRLCTAREKIFSGIWHPTQWGTYLGRGIRALLQFKWYIQISNTFHVWILGLDYAWCWHGCAKDGESARNNPIPPPCILCPRSSYWRSTFSLQSAGIITT